VIVRNAAAFGANGIVAGSNSSSPYLRRAVRNSMGSVFRLPVVHADLSRALPEIHPSCRIIAAVPAGETIKSADFSGNLCIVFGNEGMGVSEEVMKLGDAKIGIPMQNDTDSLNVASAAAVFLYEVTRTRRLL